MLDDDFISFMGNDICSYRPVMIERAMHDSVALLQTMLTSFMDVIQQRSCGFRYHRRIICQLTLYMGL
jgi:hypothetical protein